jgi:hypothetical protein
MKRRLRIYGFGVGLGLLMAWALFLRGRNTKNYTMWTPNNRILEEIRTDPYFSTNDFFWCEMKCLGFTSMDFEELLENGNVVFGESQAKSWPRIYRVELETEENGTLVVDFSKTEEKEFSVISVAKKGETDNCECE